MVFSLFVRSLFLSCLEYRLFAKKNCKKLVFFSGKPFYPIPKYAFTYYLVADSELCLNFISKSVKLNTVLTKF